jgi:hypothetical protein
MVRKDQIGTLAYWAYGAMISALDGNNHRYMECVKNFRSIDLNKLLN